MYNADQTPEWREVWVSERTLICLGVCAGGVAPVWRLRQETGAFISKFN